MAVEKEELLSKLKEWGVDFETERPKNFDIFQDKKGRLQSKMCIRDRATVQFNYHIAVDRMFYSVPYQYIKNKVDVRITDTTVEIFYNHNRIASHRRLYGDVYKRQHMHRIRMLEI